MTDLERQILDRCTDELGVPAGLMAEEFGVSTAAVTKAAKALAARGLLADTGWAMKKRRDGNWDWIESKKTEGGMTTRPGASTVWITTDAGNAALEGKETIMAKRKGSGKTEKAGYEYATDQIGSAYFHDWMRDQLIEASKMPANQVLPLETKSEAKTIARKMLQQLEWDTKREVSGKDDTFWEGFHRACASARDGIANELLEMKREIRDGASEPRLKQGRASSPGTRVRDYIAVDSRGRKIAGPFKSYSDAKDAAGPGGHTQFVPSARAREVPRGVARNVRRGRRRAQPRA